MGVTPKTNAVIKESLGLTFKQKEVLISAMIKRYIDQYRYKRPSGVILTLSYLPQIC
jgi:hypothetical protein